MEIRKDYILDRWSIIAPHREKRPMNFKQAKPEINDKECPFCQGKEDQTPPEIGRIEENGQWKIRWFQNKFGFLKKEQKILILTTNTTHMAKHLESMK